MYIRNQGAPDTSISCARGSGDFSDVSIFVYSLSVCAWVTYIYHDDELCDMYTVRSAPFNVCPRSCPRRTLSDIAAFTCGALFVMVRINLLLGTGCNAAPRSCSRYPGRSWHLTSTMISSALLLRISLSRQKHIELKINPWNFIMFIILGESIADTYFLYSKTNYYTLQWSMISCIKRLLYNRGDIQFVYIILLKCQCNGSLLHLW